MYELSYENVMKGLNLHLNMTCITPSQRQNEYIFNRAKSLWYVPQYSQVKRVERAIEFPSGVGMRFKSFTNIRLENTRGFRGVFLIHPEIYEQHLTAEDEDILSSMHIQNERYKNQWQP